MGGGNTKLLKNHYDITELDISQNYNSDLLNLHKFTKLIKLDCSVNKIKNIEYFPNSLIELNCYCNELVNLDNLPNNLSF